MSKPRRFSGKRNGPPIHELVTDVQQYLQSVYPTIDTPMQHARAIAFVTSLLEGDAKRWWYGQPSYTTLSSLLASLTAEFTDHMQIDRLQGKFFAIKQTGTLQAYNTAFRNLLHALTFSGVPRMAEPTLITRYLQGLTSPTIRYNVRLKNCTTLEQAMQVAATCDEPFRAYAGYPNGPTPMEIDMLAMHTNQTNRRRNFNAGNNHNHTNRNPQPNTSTQRATTTDEARLAQLRTHPLPKLTDADRNLLPKHNICWRCRTYQRGHTEPCPGIPQGGSQPGQH